MVLHSRILRSSIALALATLAAIAVTACAPRNSMPAPEPTQAQATAYLNPELAPRLLDPLSLETEEAEATRVADAIAELIDVATVVAVSDESQLVPADDDIAAYYATNRLYLLDASVDVATLAETIGAVLGKSGWTAQDEADEDGVTIVALAGGTEEQPWFLFVEGVTTDDGPAIKILLAGPDL